MADLTNKQRAFVEHYLATWNAAEAARRAGYSAKSARSVGPETLSKPVIQAAIEARIAELKMGADEVLVRLADQARGDLGDFVHIGEEEITLSDIVISEREEGDEGEPATMRVVRKVETVKRPTVHIDLAKAKAASKLHLIKKIKDGRDGLSIELYDAQAAVVLLGKHHKLFGDEGGGILKFIDLTKLSDAQIARLANGDDPLAVILDKQPDPA